MNIVALVVEDQHMDRFIMEQSIQKIADKVYCAGDLKKALEIVHELPEIHVVLLDLHMPGSSAREVIGSITSIRKKHPSCAIVIVSGASHDEQGDFAEHADAFVQKTAVANSSGFLSAIMLALLARAKGDDILLARLSEIAHRLFPMAA